MAEQLVAKLHGCEHWSLRIVRNGDGWEIWGSPPIAINVISVPTKKRRKK